MTKTMQEVIDAIIKERADWLVDAVATATQDRRFLRGDAAEDENATLAISMNGEKAMRVAVDRVLTAIQLAQIGRDQHEPQV